MVQLDLYLCCSKVFEYGYLWVGIELLGNPFCKINSISQANYIQVLGLTAHYLVTNEAAYEKGGDMQLLCRSFYLF